MAVPMIDLRAQYRAIKPEIDAAVAEVFESQGFVGGPKVEQFESAIARYLGVEHALSVASGTDALLLALKAAGVKEGDEVITTTFSFFATAGAIANAGATPVFVDIDPATFNIDVARIESHVTDRTRAIVPVHLYGQCADMDPIMSIAGRAHDLRVIEDAAQSLGARYKDRPACTLGDAAAISFYPTKNLGGAGDGGAVVTRDHELVGLVRLLRAHGGDRTYYHRIVGTNSRLDAIQASVLNVKLKYLDAWNLRRRERAAYYDALFADVPEVVTPKEAPGNFHVYHQYVIRLPRRDEAKTLLTRKGIGCAVFYPLPLHRQQCFQHLVYADEDFPAASRACKEVLALPMYAELTPEQQNEVVAALKEHLAAPSA
jgi:dTDP-4-amino-4,6-dideoxygalactose transaminase